MGKMPMPRREGVSIHVLSDIRLAMTTCTHFGLVDTAGAVETLPTIRTAEPVAVVAAR
jgi:hypothetical protein